MKWISLFLTLLVKHMVWLSDLLQVLISSHCVWRKQLFPCWFWVEKSVTQLPRNLPVGKTWQHGDLIFAWLFLFLFFLFSAGAGECGALCVASHGAGRWPSWHQLYPVPWRVPMETGSGMRYSFLLWVDFLYFHWSAPAQSQLQCMCVSVRVSTGGCGRPQSEHGAQCNPIICIAPASSAVLLSSGTRSLMDWVEGSWLSSTICILHAEGLSWFQSLASPAGRYPSRNSAHPNFSPNFLWLL